MDILIFEASADAFHRGLFSLGTQLRDDFGDGPVLVV
jgi:hypothetical protein